MLNSIISYIKTLYFSIKHRGILKKNPSNFYFGSIKMTNGKPHIDSTCSFGIAFEHMGAIDLTGNSDLNRE